jgi:RecA/RadA recombinase
MTEDYPVILGSELLRRVQIKNNKSTNTLLTGFKAIDDVLQQSLKYGQITSIAGGSATGKSIVGSLSIQTKSNTLELSLHIISNHIFIKKSNVAIIDTNGSFDPTRLLSILKTRIESGKIYYQTS